jgi:hypothetical protein
MSLFFRSAVHHLSIPIYEWQPSVQYGRENFEASGFQQHRLPFLSSVICSLDSRPLMALLMATLKDGPDRKLGVSPTAIAQGPVRIFSSLSCFVRCMMAYFVMCFALNIPY